MSVADPGLDRLRAAVLDRSVERRPSRRLAAAREAHPPLLPLSDPAALVVPAPTEPPSMVGLGRGVYWALRTQLEAHGVPVEGASRVALRAARLALLEAVGVGRVGAMDRLAISSRSLGRARVLLRGLDPDAIADGELLPRVPANVAVGRAGAPRVGLRAVGAGVGEGRHPEGDAERDWRRCA